MSNPPGLIALRRGATARPCNDEKYVVEIEGLDDHSQPFLYSLRREDIELLAEMAGIPIWIVKQEEAKESNWVLDTPL